MKNSFRIQRHDGAKSSDHLTVNPKSREWSVPTHTLPPIAGHDFSHVNLFAHDPGPRPYPQIQPKLTVGAPNDQYEQEADRVAEQVMSMPDPAVQRQEEEESELDVESDSSLQTKPVLQRQEEEESELDAESDSSLQTKLLQTKPVLQRQEEEESELDAESDPSLQTKPVLQRQEVQPDVDQPVQTKPTLQRSPNNTLQAGDNIESQLNSSKGSGSPLPDNVRSFMEPRFGADFSSVRVHTSSNAVQMNQELGAQAFTHGQDIYYGAGKNPSNDPLTGHELTHVLQQGGATRGAKMQTLSRKLTTQSGNATAVSTSPSGMVQAANGKASGFGSSIINAIKAIIEEVNFALAKSAADPSLKADDVGSQDRIPANAEFYIMAKGKKQKANPIPNDLVVKIKSEKQGGYVVKYGKHTLWVAKGNLVHTTSGFKKVDGPLFPENDPPSPDHVKQTTLGDCYLQAALAGVAAQNPEYIKGMMRDSGDGNVAVRLYEVDQTDYANHKFKPKYIKVAKSIPVDKEGQEVYNVGSTWVRMVEKAYAAGGFTGSGAAPTSKKPSYEDIEGGFSRHAFEVILGEASKAINLGGGATYNETKDQYEDPGTIVGNQGNTTWTTSNPVSFPWDSNAIQQYDTVKAKTPDDYSSLALLMQIFQNDKAKVDEWMTFVKTGKIKDKFKAQATDQSAGHSTAITLTDLGQLFDGKSFKDDMLKWLSDQKLFPGALGTGLYSKNQLDVFNSMKDALATGQPVALSSNQKITKGEGGSGASGGEQTYGGLAGGHAYTVLLTKATKSNNPNDAEVGEFHWVKIRNPWGDNAYAKDEKPLPGFIDVGAGMFFLELSQLTTYFNRVDIGATPS